jgi:hypothetical protein
MPEIPTGAIVPQDHLSRSEPHRPFTFTVGGNMYQLPEAVEATQVKIPSKILRSAALGEPLGEMGLMFGSLDCSGADTTTLDALYSLPFDEMAEIYQQWVQHKTTPEAASLGESGDSPT